MKKQRGITLVALVITIIILLILAGISISALTNQGLFKQAQNAKNLTEEKTAEENEILTNYLEQMNAIIGGQVTESIPDGATVTPINDIKTWLRTAGISKQYSYTTIEQVIADSTCTKSLMNNENAMKYLVRSTEFADAICASETAMTYLGQSEYVDNTVLNSDIWVEAIKASPYKWSVLESPVVSWSTASDSDISKMLDAYYNGDITIDDIKTKNAVGDTRSVTLSAMSATYVTESHVEQIVEYTIIDFEHDDLSTPINDKSKALLTVQQKDCLLETGNMCTNTIVYTNTNRRTWLNSVYYNAIPAQIRTAIKDVSKSTLSGNWNSDATKTVGTEKCFLLSETEVYSTTPFTTKTGEGTIYPYYNNTTNRIKRLGSGSNTKWYLRTGYYANGYNAFTSINTSGVKHDGQTYDEAYNVNMGIAPAFCL